MPAGLDPDDLINQQGVAALDQLLAEPASLLDTLWMFERDAHELRTPEDKAGLKARLLQHVDAIEHPDIRALYKRELLERFSNFAFPPRPKREWKPGTRANWQPSPRLSVDAAAKLRQSLSGGARDEFGRAVIHGLLKHPGEIIRHTEALGKLARHDAKMTETVESLLEVAETLDSHGQVAISGAEGLPAPPDMKRYAFLRESTDPVDAREELAEAVALLVERPALLSALDATKSRFETDPEGAFAEQTRLRERLASLNTRLKEFGRKKAGVSAGLEISREDANEEALSDMKTD